MSFEAPLLTDLGQVEVVVSRHDGHFPRARHLPEKTAGLRVLALERKVCEVAGDDHVIRMQRSRREDGNEILAPVDAPAAQGHVGVAEEALVEPYPPPLGAQRRQDVKVRYMRDP